MLKLEYLFENFELAKTALENWEHEEEGLENYFCHFRISSNAVYPFPREGKTCFLRLSPVEEKEERNLLGELEFLMYLDKKGYTAMRPVPSKSGELLLKLDTSWGNYYASAFCGVSGICIEDSDYNDEIMYAYGKSLGRLHQLSMEYEPACRKSSYEDALVWIREILMEQKAPDIMRAEVNQVAEELKKLPKYKANYGLIHYDFEPDNVFYDAEKKCCNVIDFEDGMYHFYLQDIEQVLDALRGELDETRYQHAEELFLQGYQSEKLLTPGYREELLLMHRFCNLYGYARLLHCMSKKPEPMPDWMSQICDKLTERMKYIENFTARMQCISG